MNGISMVATSPGANNKKPQQVQILTKVTKVELTPNFAVRQDSPVGVNPVDITGYQVNSKFKSTQVNSSESKSTHQSHHNSTFCFPFITIPPYPLRIERRPIPSFNLSFLLLLLLHALLLHLLFSLLHLIIDNPPPPPPHSSLPTRPSSASVEESDRVCTARGASRPLKPTLSKPRQPGPKTPNMMMMHCNSSRIKTDSDDGAADARVRPSLWPWRTWRRPSPPPLPPAS